jgi:hypothetical protein
MILLKRGMIYKKRAVFFSSKSDRASYSVFINCDRLKITTHRNSDRHLHLHLSKIATFPFSFQK